VRGGASDHMALCFAHTAAGYLGYEAVRPAGPHRAGLFGAAVLLANGPDLDFLPGILVGQPAAYHRGVTHTLAALVAVGLAVWLLERFRGRPPAGPAVWAAAVYASHLLLDFFTTNTRPPCGGRFLWPLSDQYYLSPVTPLQEIVIDPSGRVAFVRSLVQPHTAGVWAEEVAILACAVVAVHLARTLWAGVVAPMGEVADPP